MDKSIVENVCEMRNQFDKIIAAHNDDEGFVDSVLATLEENEMLAQDRIKEDYRKNAESERLLKVGIVGAVKAGKSSLLNALFFSGNDILPKAATPMTAALTELTYGEKCEILVDFFTDSDIQTLKAKSEQYEREYERLKKETLKQRMDSWLSAQKRKNPEFNSSADTEQKSIWQKDSENSAKRKLDENVSLAGAYEQYEKIKTSKTPRKNESETIIVSSVSEIEGKLEAYVGSSGIYMPFTSKVSIKLPIDALK
ncbi:MAG: dynamin family protein, partial [Treponemataceae bacterium]